MVNVYILMKVVLITRSKANIVDKIYKIYENTEPEVPATTFFTIYGKDSNGEPKQKNIHSK